MQHAAFSSGERGLLFVAVLGLLIVVASLVEPRALGEWVQLPHGMWDLPRPGIEPISPALAGVFLTTGPLERSDAACLTVLPDATTVLHGKMPFSFFAIASHF